MKTLGKVGKIFSMGLLVFVFLPTTVFAQYSYSGGSDYSYSGGSDYSYGGGFDYSYSGDSDYSYSGGSDYSYSNGSDYSYSGGSDYSYSNDSDYSYSGDSDYSYSGGSDYSYSGDSDYSYSGGSDYSYSGGSYTPIYSYSGSSYGYSGSSYGGSYSGSIFSFGKNKDRDYPVCKEFKASRTSLSEGGGNVTLTWDTKDADVVQISGIGSVTKDGSRTIFVDQSRTFTLTAYGDGYDISCHTSVYVDAPTTHHPVDIDAPRCGAFYASPSFISEGDSTTLIWNTSDAVEVSIDNGIGSVSLDGSRTVSPSSTTTYTLTAENSEGETVTCTESVVVEKDTPTAIGAPQCNSFYASPAVIYDGDSTTLIWNTSDAVNVSINHGIGSVALDGSRTVSPSNNTTYTLTAENSEGEMVTCTESVVVEDDTPVSHNDLSCDSFYASPSTVDEGDDFRLFWSTTGADEVYINNGVGHVSQDGSIWLEADEDDDHYILTASSGGDQVTCSEFINVDDDDDDNDRPRCDLDASDDDIDEGDRVRLSWDNQRADDIRLRDDHGEEYFDTRHSSRDRKDYDEDDDSIYVYPDEDTRYTLTVYNEDGSRTCSVRIEVDENGGSVASANITRTGQVAGIAVSNVPYTGFEAGPLLTTLFYTILALWGVGIAYILVIHKRPAVASTTQAVASVAPVETPKPDVPEDMGTFVAEEPAIDRRSTLRRRAEEERILLAPDAGAFIREQAETEQEQLYLFNKIADLAKATFPMEDGWIALDRKRIESIIEDA
ncbi:hypothetical protein KTR10_03530 [Candidatus Kaiserbacteria bacterium]|nr:hypothetical protein [Candidatus Kaiserbacteria bacterium]